MEAPPKSNGPRDILEWNLSKVYKKLHVRSRAELAAKLARQAQG
jgi:hypothetical protein